MHVRKLDAPGHLHRRILAGITIEAPLPRVWAALTDYERLPSVVPSLVLSELVPASARRAYPANMRRLRQLAVKQLPYVELHTEIVLDVLEKPAPAGGAYELQFRQYDGDFDVLQVSPLSNAVTELCYRMR